MPTLSLILWLPLFGAAFIACVPDARHRLIRGIALFHSAATLLLSFGLLAGFDPGLIEPQFGEHAPWNPALGSGYTLGVDGLSLPLVLLAALLSFVAVLASASIRERVKGYHAWLLMLETGMLGVFLAQDWALFFLFWEMTLIPLFFLIDRWGGARRHLASLNFVLYTMGGAVFMLIALLMVFQSSPEHSAAMSSLLQAGRALDRDTQILVFVGLLIGFGVKLPIFPLHGWLPLAHVEAPSPVSILLSGALLKMGGYGILRACQMLPDAALALQPVLAGLALFSLIYGGLLAWRQSDLKAMIAYSSVSHMGIVLLGIATLNPAGLAGAMLQSLAHGLVAGAMFLLVGLLYERTHTREIADYSSLIHTMPRFAVFTTLVFLASMGLPGTIGFVAELHALIGGFQQWGWWMLVTSAGVLISAAYALRTIERLFTGPVRPEMRGIPDLQPREWLAAGTLVGGIAGLGIMPDPALELSGETTTRMGAYFAAHKVQTVASANAAPPDPRDSAARAAP
ncbi:MAG TPA: NADH-quinone oxidoreductase subunit M [Methylococcaceae bacterium]|nr:NADH-quinone oxidoreductase subunit M [Methylococcaceae bacterium]